MCTAFLAGLGMAAQTAMQIKASNDQYNAQINAAAAQKQAAEQNANLKKAEAEQSALKSAQEQKKLTAQYRLAEGQRNAAMGASGLAGNVGSGLDLASASRNAYVSDSMNLLSNQRQNTWNSYIQEVNYRNQASAYQQQMDSLKSSKNMAAFATILGNVGSFYGKYGKVGSTATNKLGMTDYSSWKNMYKGWQS